MSIRLNPETHRLTSLPGEKHPHKCQRCGGKEKLARWIEHDHNDTPESLWLVLCDRCSKEIIEPHPRLYRRLEDKAPCPGCMSICIDCKYREGVRCNNPLAEINGGPGLKYEQTPPAFAFCSGTRGGRRTGWREAIYFEPVKACSGKET